MERALPLSALHLRESDRNHLLAILNRLLPTATAWAYGSRVSGTAHEASDLDLVLRSPTLEPIALEALNQFKLALRDSNIPILIDVRDWARLPPLFQDEILKQYVVLAT